jgi:hypothetical protein
MEICYVIILDIVKLKIVQYLVSQNTQNPQFTYSHHWPIEAVYKVGLGAHPNPIDPSHFASITKLFSGMLLLCGKGTLIVCQVCLLALVNGKRS